MLIRTFDVQTLTTSLFDQYGQEAEENAVLSQEIVDECRPQEALARVREERNRRLVEADWTQLPDSPLSDASKARWAQYRQALRDITNNFVWNSTRWPNKPTT